MILLAIYLKIDDNLIEISCISSDIYVSGGYKYVKFNKARKLYW